MSAALHTRPDKLEDYETVLYEIDMLRFTKDRLMSADPFKSEGEEWVYLEAFLLHFRNLIEFFRGKSSRTDDLSIAQPDVWPNQKTPTVDLTPLNRPDLWTKYEEIPERISKYLQHCTKQRVIKKKWDVQAMYEDLRPVLEKFEALLPEYKPATKPAMPQPVSATGTLGAGMKSTASGAQPSLTPPLTPQP
ncbi:MAG TPA: hypothetical protein VFF39_14135 [Verrucomicrobiae bacterium]|nr:hypothetical protein [Verrucomicrobiae bacterium]